MKESRKILIEFNKIKRFLSEKEKENFFKKYNKQLEREEN